MTTSEIDKILIDEESLRLEISNLSGSMQLDRDKLIDRYVEVEFAEKLNACKTEEERERKKSFYVEYYTNGPGKNFINSCVSSLNNKVKCTESAITNLKNVCTGIAADNVVPSVITTGAATSVPNPTWNLLSNKQKVALCLNAVDSAIDFLIQVYSVALLLHLEIPVGIANLSGNLRMVSTLIKAIPV